MPKPRRESSVSCGLAKVFSRKVLNRRGQGAEGANLVHGEREILLTQIGEAFQIAPS